MAIFIIIWLYQLRFGFFILVIFSNQTKWEQIPQMIDKVRRQSNTIKYFATDIIYSFILIYFVLFVVRYYWFDFVVGKQQILSWYHIIYYIFDVYTLIKNIICTYTTSILLVRPSKTLLIPMSTYIHEVITLLKTKINDNENNFNHIHTIYIIYM